MKPWERLSWTKGHPRPEVFMEKWRPAIRGPPVLDPTPVSSASTSFSVTVVQSAPVPEVAVAVSVPESKFVLSVEDLHEKRKKLRELFDAPPMKRENINRKLRVKSVETLKRKIHLNGGPPNERQRSSPRQQ